MHQLTPLELAPQMIVRVLPCTECSLPAFGKGDQPEELAVYFWTNVKVDQEQTPPAAG